MCMRRHQKMAFNHSALFCLLLLISRDLGLANGHRFSKPLSRPRRSLQDDNEVTGELSFSLSLHSTKDCDLGLTNGGLYSILEYRLLQSKDPVGDSTWEEISVISISTENCTQCFHNFSRKFTYWKSTDESIPSLVQFRLVQWEHGGGECNCWAVVPGSWVMRAENNSVQHLLQ